MPGSLRVDGRVPDLREEGQGRKLRSWGLGEEVLLFTRKEARKPTGSQREGRKGHCLTRNVGTPPWGKKVTRRVGGGVPGNPPHPPRRKRKKLATFEKESKTLACRHKTGVRPALREPGPKGDSVQGPVPNHLGKSKLSHQHQAERSRFLPP